MFEFFAQFAKPLLVFGVSIAGSSVQGFITKNKTKANNDTIPVRNSATWGTGGIAAGAAMDDPLSMVAGFAGATVASIGHKLIGKIFGGNKTN